MNSGHSEQTGRTGQESAFSLLEVLAVIVILGILALAAYPRLTSTTRFTAEVAADLVSAEIRSTQARALFSGTPRTISFSGNTYTVDGETRNLPGGAVATGQTIDFNPFGEPVAGAGEPISISSGDDIRTVTVAPLTGKVTIN